VALSTLLSASDDSRCDPRWKPKPHDLDPEPVPPTYPSPIVDIPLSMLSPLAPGPGTITVSLPFEVVWTPLPKSSDLLDQIALSIGIEWLA
jgi:hypothetical protein